MKTEKYKKLQKSETSKWQFINLYKHFNSKGAQGTVATAAVSFSNYSDLAMTTGKTSCYTMDVQYR